MKLYVMALAAAAIATYIVVASPALSADSATPPAQEIQGTNSATLPPESAKMSLRH